MFIGRYISCDEQDIGLQGQQKDKQRVTFKKVGDVFCLMLFMNMATHTRFNSGTKLHQRVGLRKVYHHYMLES